MYEGQCVCVSYYPILVWFLTGALQTQEKDVKCRVYVLVWAFYCLIVAF